MRGAQERFSRAYEIPLAWMVGAPYVAPHAATHVPLALRVASTGLRNDVKRSGSPDPRREASGFFIWSLVRSTVSQLRPSPS